MRSLIERVSNWLFPPRPPEVWPDRIQGRDLVVKVGQLHADGYCESAMENFAYRQIRFETWFVKRRVEIPNELTCRRVHFPTVQLYAKRPDPPPIVFGRYGEVVDGVQRLFAAQVRGDREIWAYVPEDCITPPRLL